MSYRFEVFWFWNVNVCLFGKPYLRGIEELEIKLIFLFELSRIMKSMNLLDQIATIVPIFSFTNFYMDTFCMIIVIWALYSPIIHWLWMYDSHDLKQQNII